MIIRKAFKFRLKPSKEVAEKFEEASRACRFVWNKALGVKKSAIEYINKECTKLGYEAIKDKKERQKLRNSLFDRYFPTRLKSIDHFLNHVLKKSDKYGFLSNPSSIVLQQKLMDLEKANDAFKTRHSKGVGFPRFKKKDEEVSFRFTHGFKIEGVGDNKKNKKNMEKDTVYIPKISEELGCVKYINSRKIEGTPKNITITKKCGHWYMSVQVEIEKESNECDNRKDAVGIDVGVINFLAFSDSEKNEGLEPANDYKKHSEKLALPKFWYFKKFR